MSPPAHERGPSQNVPQPQSMDMGSPRFLPNSKLTAVCGSKQPEVPRLQGVCQVCRRNQRAKNKMVLVNIYATRRTRLRYEHQARSLHERSQRRQFAFLGTRRVAGCRL